MRSWFSSSKKESDKTKKEAQSDDQDKPIEKEWGGLGAVEPLEEVASDPRTPSPAKESSINKSSSDSKEQVEEQRSSSSDSDRSESSFPPSTDLLAQLETSVSDAATTTPDASPLLFDPSQFTFGDDSFSDSASSFSTDHEKMNEAEAKQRGLDFLRVLEDSSADIQAEASHLDVSMGSSTFAPSNPEAKQRGLAFLQNLQSSASTFGSGGEQEVSFSHPRQDRISPLPSPPTSRKVSPTISPLSTPPTSRRVSPSTSLTAGPTMAPSSSISSSSSSSNDLVKNQSSVSDHRKSQSSRQDSQQSSPLLPNQAATPKLANKKRPELKQQQSSFSSLEDSTERSIKPGEINKERDKDEQITKPPPPTPKRRAARPGPLSSSAASTASHTSQNSWKRRALSLLEGLEQEASVASLQYDEASVGSRSSRHSLLSPRTSSNRRQLHQGGSQNSLSSLLSPASAGKRSPPSPHQPPIVLATSTRQSPTAPAPMPSISHQPTTLQQTQDTAITPCAISDDVTTASMTKEIPSSTFKDDFRARARVLLGLADDADQVDPGDRLNEERSESEQSDAEDNEDEAEWSGYESEETDNNEHQSSYERANQEEQSKPAAWSSFQQRDTDSSPQLVDHILSHPQLIMDSSGSQASSENKAESSDEEKDPSERSPVSSLPDEDAAVDSRVRARALLGEASSSENDFRARARSLLGVASESSKNSSEQSSQTEASGMSERSQDDHSSDEEMDARSDGEERQVFDTVSNVPHSSPPNNQGNGNFDEDRSQLNMSDNRIDDYSSEAQRSDSVSVSFKMDLKDRARALIGEKLECVEDLRNRFQSNEDQFNPSVSSHVDDDAGAAGSEHHKHFGMDVFPSKECVSESSPDLQTGKEQLGGRRIRNDTAERLMSGESVLRTAESDPRARALALLGGDDVTEYGKKSDLIDIDVMEIGSHDSQSATTSRLNLHVRDQQPQDSLQEKSAHSTSASRCHGDADNTLTPNTEAITSNDTEILSEIDFRAGPRANREKFSPHAGHDQGTNEDEGEFGGGIHDNHSHMAKKSTSSCSELIFRGRQHQIRPSVIHLI